MTELFQYFFFILATSGLVYILTESTLFLPGRMLIWASATKVFGAAPYSVRALVHNILGTMYCRTCVSFWMGMGMAALGCGVSFGLDHGTTVLLHGLLMVGLMLWGAALLPDNRAAALEYELRRPLLADGGHEEHEGDESAAARVIADEISMMGLILAQAASVEQQEEAIRHACTLLKRYEAHELHAALVEIVKGIPRQAIADSLDHLIRMAEDAAHEIAVTGRVPMQYEAFVDSLRDNLRYFRAADEE